MSDELAYTGPWECFQDASYYDMWCVRQAHDRMFGRGFHLVNGDEAAGLRDLLNTRATDHPNADDWRNRCERAEAEATELREENARLREALAGVIDGEPCRFDHHGYCQAHYATNPCEMAFARAALGENTDG